MKSIKILGTIVLFSLLLFYGLIKAEDTLLFSLNTFLTFLLFSVSYNEYVKGRIFGPVNAFSLLICVHFIIPFYYESLGVNIYNIELLSTYKYKVLFYIFFIVILLLFYSYNRKYNISNDKYIYSSKRSYINVVYIFLVIGYLARIYLISQNLYFQHSRGSESNLNGSFMLTWLVGFEKYPFYALVILAVSRAQGVLKNDWWFRLTFIMELIYWFPAGRKEEIIATLVFPVIVLSFYQNVKILTLKNLVLVLVIFVVFPATRFIRSGLEILEFSANQKSLSVRDVIVALPKAYNLGAEKVTQMSNSVQRNEANPNLKRLSLVEPVSGCLYLTEIDGFKFGESYLFMFIFPIPRFIWHDKPQSTHGVEFGKRIGLVKKGNTSSISISYIGESFWNFGFAGVIVLFLFLEMVIRFYELAKRK